MTMSEQHGRRSRRWRLKVSTAHAERNGAHTHTEADACGVARGASECRWRAQKKDGTLLFADDVDGGIRHVEERVYVCVFLATLAFVLVPRMAEQSGQPTELRQVARGR